MTSINRIVSLLFLLAAAAGPALAQTPGKVPIKIRKGERVTSEQVKTLVSQTPAKDRTTSAELAALKAKNPVRYGREFKKVDDSVAAAPPRGNLYEDSLILSDGKVHTLLPKGALIHVPETYAARVVIEPVGKLVFWPEFSRNNRNWVRPQEVTMQTALGETPFSEPMVNRFKLQKMVVVSVLRGSPITVLEPKEPEGEIEGAPTTTSTGTKRFDTARR